MIITITGSLGSGKSTIGKILADKLNYEYISGGSIFRKIAQEHGEDINEINKEAEVNSKLDYEVDMYLKGLSWRDNLVIDSRLAWHFIENSIKIYLYTDLETAIDRISKSDRTTEGNIKNKQELMKNLTERRKSEIKRFKRIYGIDIEDKRNYDLVIDTDKLEPLDVVERVARYIEEIW